MDIARHQGGWGRIKYVNDQLSEYCPEKKLPDEYVIPEWNSKEYKVRDYQCYLEALEERGVYFSYPLDLDYSMILSFPKEYKAKKETHDEIILKSVLGKRHHDPTQYTYDELSFFHSYHKGFKINSKPATHIDALASLSDEDLRSHIPESLARLADSVIKTTMELPE